MIRHFFNCSINDVRQVIHVTVSDTVCQIKQFTRLHLISNLSLWLSGLIHFLSHSTCWAYLAGDLQRPGIKSGSRHELSVRWTNGRYAMRLISRTGTEGPPVSSLNCDRCRLWSYDITAGYKCEYYYIIITVKVKCSQFYLHYRTTHDESTCAVTSEYNKSFFCSRKVATKTAKITVKFKREGQRPLKSYHLYLVTPMWDLKFYSFCVDRQTVRRTDGQH